MTMKEEFTAIDMATAAADGFRAGQRAAQSAPAGEREAFELASVDDSFGSLRALGAEAERRGLENGDYIDFAARKAWEYFQAGAAWQRAQGERVPEGWISVSERLPESERAVLAFYLNSHGKGRRVRGEYIAAKTKSADDGWDSDEPADYDEQEDEYFWPAGWYEVMDNWDDLTHMVIHEGEVTHWMPLPTAPSPSKGGE
ncbi:DUF551 domain-containing protein [Pseudomonas mendocina]|nr:DUF551 domain-containing protein [Pseudomonas mendocina]MDV5862041.1 DUF551 domain-containing protein [Pseudomonas mendocina]